MNNRLTTRDYLLLAALTIAGLLGSICAIPLVAGFSYLPGSIAVLLIVRLFGLQWGAFAGIVSSFWTIRLFGHPYAMIWLTLEPLAVGWLLARSSERTRNLITFDTLYWSLIGAPLIWLSYRHGTDAPALDAVATMLMFWVTGITNALAASILLSHVPSLSTGVRFSGTIPIRHVIFNLTMATLLVPSLIITFLHIRNMEQNCLKELYDHLEDTARTAAYETRIVLERYKGDWLRLDQSGIPSRTHLFDDIARQAAAEYNLKLALLDGGGKVITANALSRLQPGQPYNSCPDGKLLKVTPTGIQRCEPRLLDEFPSWQRIQLTHYIFRRPIASDSLWTIAIEGDYAPYQQQVLRDHIGSLFSLMLLVLATLLISSVTSRRLATPLRRLAQVTTDLPERLVRERISVWPQSMVTEIDLLVGNVRDMADALSHRISEMTSITGSLEQRVEERTRELNTANSQLQKEIAEHELTGRQRDHLMEELVGQVRFLQTLIDSIPNPVFYKDTAGRYQGCNRAFEEQWGFTRDQIIGKTVYQLYPADRADTFDAADRELYAHLGVQTYDTQARIADGSTHEITFYKAVYYGSDGNLAGLVGTVIDITQRKQAEMERDRLMLELTRKNKELEGIVYVASHDLRSPLVNVQGFSRKLIKTCADLDAAITRLAISDDEREALNTLTRESIPRSLNFITTSVVKMDGLLNGLLRLSRLGRASLCFETIDMDQLTGNVISSITWQIEKAGGTITVDHLAPCLGDTVQVTQVFSNLIENAVKYRSPGRPLHVRLYCEEFTGGIRYCVEDNGVGIAANEQDKVWEIFQRLNPRETSGEGLGLTLVRRICDRLGGSVWLESDPGMGSRFYVLLPKPPAP